jgi:hypothetical protein
MLPVFAVAPSTTDEPVIVPDPLIVPAPVGLMVTVAPGLLTLPATVILPPAPVRVAPAAAIVPALILMGAALLFTMKVNAPEAVMPLVVFMPPALLSIILTVDPLDVPLPVNAAESVKETAPVVVNVTFGVFKLAVIPPVAVPLPKVTDVEPLTIPVPLIAPEPVGMRLTVVPARVPPLTTI